MTTKRLWTPSWRPWQGVEEARHLLQTLTCRTWRTKSCKSQASISLKTKKRTQLNFLLTHLSLARTPLTSETRKLSKLLVVETSLAGSKRTWMWVRRKKSSIKRTLTSSWRRSLIRRWRDGVTTMTRTMLKKWPNLNLARLNKNRQKTSHLLKRRLKNRWKRSSLR